MAEMTPTLRTAILAALMERWREFANSNSVFMEEPLAREYMSAYLDMILPVAEPMIREAALREAAAAAKQCYFRASRDYVATVILALGEPK